MEKKEEVIEKVKFLLGYPTIDIELDNESFEEDYYTAVEDFKMFSLSSQRLEEKLNEIKDIWIKKYTLAVAKEILGRIRRKFEKIEVAGVNLKTDFASLIKESQEEKIFLFKICIMNSMERFVY